MIEITKWPVIVIANYRTGSTELSHSIFSKYDQCQWFPEPHYDDFKIQKLKSCVKNEQYRFVLKIMIDQLDYFPEYRSIINQNSTLIRLRRRNVVDQILSYYIARKTQKWTMSKYQGIVQLDYELIEQCILWIVQNNKKLDDLSSNFDYDLYYEDLNFTNSLSEKNLDVANKERLKQIIQKLLDK